MAKTSKKDDKKLPPKQVRFVAEYLKDLNGTQAAIRAHYNEKSARSQAAILLAKPSIKAAVQAGMDKRAKALELDAQYVLEGIKRVTARCEQAEPVLDREGNPTGEYTFQAQAALKGYELLGKHIKLFTEKHEVSGADGGPVVVSLTTDDERI